MSSAPDTYALFVFLYRHVTDVAIGERHVARVEHDTLLRAAAEVYRENMRLRARLRELERLASSWTGTPERSPEIVSAREALRDSR